ncbi:hypothetical protein N7512_001098 [Penicillium capsulatum]|nr:hypothetical protein N7512_001098 [Penicillium capsulatum]
MLVIAESLHQMTRKAKATIAAFSTVIVYISVNSIARTLNPTAFVWCEEDRDESNWIATSKSWIDRKSCRWFGVCGATHFQRARGRFGHRDPTEWASSQDAEPMPWRSYWFDGANQSEWDADEWARREIPSYVLDYAPLVHLYSGEQFWPGDIAEHLYYTTPSLNYTPIQAQWDHPSLSNLDELNQWNSRHVFLTSNDDPQSRPPWLEGEKNIPEPGPEDKARNETWGDWDGRVDGRIPQESAQWLDLNHEQNEDEAETAADLDSALDTVKEELRKRYGGKPIQETTTGAGGRSDAPAVLLVMDKGNGVVDAFWFFFYSFNLGNTVVNVRFGNHVGDWEHCLIRFHHGKPKALFFSAHTAGEAYRYEAVEKIGQRPVIYSAEGSHAMYATAGLHPYVLPWGLLHDVTDRGPLWDPLLNSHAYTYDYNSDTLRSSNFSPSAPTEWFYFDGHWGDKYYPLGDSRQYRFAGQYHYVNGPIGPRWKRLGRRKMCQGPDDAPCVIRDWIGDGMRAPRWAPSDPGE